MITTVTLNPCIDYTAYVRDFTVGKLNLMEKSQMNFSGKGINVSVVLKELGAKTFATGISFSKNHNMLLEHLKNAEIPNNFAVEEGSIRTNVKLMHTELGKMTEINNKGENVSENVISQTINNIVDCCKNSKMLIISGRIPFGARTTIYKEIIEAVAEFDCKIILDAEGEALSEGVKAKPYLIKPNERELEMLTGVNSINKAIIARACLKIIDEGVKMVCVSLGENGAIIVDSDSAYYAAPVDVDVKGTTGAGDSMVAGASVAIYNNLELSEVLSYGVACATATVMRTGTYLCQKGSFDKILPKVKVTRI